jgi:hypothetical protein
LFNSFQDKVKRIFDQSYEPTNEDILQLRTVTQTVSVYSFCADGQNVHFIDVSGLRHHRSSWLSYFDHSNAVVFVTSLSAYNQSLSEDSTINRMVDAIVLFEQLINNPLLMNLGFILFLNKLDLYKKKVKFVSISLTFPEYQGTINLIGKDNSYSQGLKFFEKKFKSQCKSSKRITTHLTQATDTNTMRVLIVELL